MKKANAQKYSDVEVRRIIRLRDVQRKDFSEICGILNLTQRKARSLYQTALYRMRKKRGGLNE